MTKRAVILLSGGLDSATAAACARRDGYGLVAMTFLYGQKHAIELEAARRCARFFGVEEHLEIPIPSDIFLSALIRGGSDIPRDRVPDDSIPSTYVPARNIIFLSYALALAESRGCSAVYIGANAVDYSGYPDCRPNFFNAFREVILQGTRNGVEGNPPSLEVPLLDLSKGEIIRLGRELGVDYGITHSCYDPDDQGRACGHCDSCHIRHAGFISAGVDDPTVYR